MMLAAIALGIPVVDAASTQSFAVVVGGASVRATGSGVLVVPLQCPGAQRDACMVQITISAKRRSARIVVAQRTLSVKRTNRSTVHVALTRVGLGLLVSSPAYQLPVSIQMRATGGTDQTARLQVNRTVFMGKTATRCWPHHSLTAVLMGGGRVYQFVSRPEAGYGCLFDRGRDYSLDVPVGETHFQQLEGGPGFGSPAIATPYVAYGEQAPQTSTAPNAFSPTTIVVMNLRSGKVLHKGPSDKPPEAPRSVYEPAHTAVSSTGVAAWTIESNPAYVNALDAHGWHEIATATASFTPVGPGIDVNYIRVVRHTVHWLQNGRMQSTTLPR